jgi:iron complex outermembrane receptor protein
VIDRQSALDSAVRLPGSNNDLRQCEAGVTPATAPTPCVDWTPYYRSVSGLPNLYSPKLSYSASLDYDFAVADGARLTPRIGVSHVDEQDTNLVRREDFYALPAHTILNASVTYIRNDWLVQAYCNNCSDKTYIASVQSDQAWNNVLYGNPRNYGVRVRRDF